MKQSGARNGSPMEYAELEAELLLEMLDLVASWVGRRIRVDPASAGP